MMAVRIDLSPFDPTSIGQRWKNWIKRFKSYLTAMNIEDDEQKRALLLYQAGEATQEIFAEICSS